MAWTKVGQDTFNIPADSSDTTVTLPGTPLENDVVIIAMAADQAVAPGIQTTGYTDLEATGAANPGHQIAYKQLGATPDIDVVIQQTSGNEFAAGVVQVWWGADISSPIDATRTVATSGSGMPDSPSYTTVTDGALVFAVGTLDDDNVASGVTAPSGYGDLLAHDNDPDGAPDNATVMIASLEKATAGAEDPAVFGGSGTDEWRAITFALRPAAAAGDIDTAEKRKSVSGTWLPLIPGVTPNSGKDSEWRWEAGWNYSGRAPAGATTKTTSLEAALQKQFEISASLNAGVQKEFTRTASADAAVAALNTKTADLEAAVQATVTRTLGLQATVQKSLTRTASLHAGVSMAMTLTASLAAALELARAGAANLEAALRQAETRSAGLDASITADGLRTITTSLTAALELARDVSAQADAALQMDRIASALTDAALRIEVQRQAGLAAALMLARAGAANLEAALRKAEARSAGLDASITAVGLRTIATSLAAALELARDVSAQADAALAGNVLLGAGLDASLDLLIAPAGTRTFGHTEDRDQVVTAGDRTFGHDEDRDQVITVGGRTFVVPAGNRKH